MTAESAVDIEPGLQPVNTAQTVQIGYDNDLAAIPTTQRGLKSRHAQMIALGGTIGTGLFVGSGQALLIGGPLFFVLGYCIITILVYGIVTATTEMSSYLPVVGSSMAYYGNRFYSRSIGVALGWLYFYVFAISVPAEITAASIVVEYWHPDVHIAVWITIFMVVIIGLNCFPVKYYGETEFWFASLKVFGIIGLLIMAVVLIFGGGPNHQRLGFHYWKDPGLVNEYLVTGSSGRLCAFVGTTTFSVFAFAFAPELLVVTGGEMQSPRRNLPRAGKRYFWRLITFYVLGSLAISMIISSDDDRLLSGGKGAGASPWAIAAKNAGINGLDSVINAVILTSAWSAGNSYLFLASRALFSMAESGNAPKVFLKCTLSGIPYVATATCAVFCLLAYMNVSSSTSTVFNWFVNLINTGAYNSWIMICIVYLRFRKVTAAQKITDLPYRSRLQPVMSYVSGSVLTLLLILGGFKNFVNGNWNTSNFITSYVGIPIFLAFWLGHKFFRARKEPWVIPLEEVDMHAGLDEVIAREGPPRGRETWLDKFKALWE
ncbi:Proline-specific permease [Exophiala dermatitidis]